MTSHLQALLNRIKELDEKRTPGEWRKGRNDMDSFHLNGVQFASVYTGDSVAETAVIRAEVVNCHENAQFIATLANECAKLVKIVETLHKGCEQTCECEFGQKLCDDGIPRVTVIQECVACESLKQAEKIADGSGND